MTYETRPPGVSDNPIQLLITYAMSVVVGFLIEQRCAVLSGCMAGLVFAYAYGAIRFSRANYKYVSHANMQDHAFAALNGVIGTTAWNFDAAWLFWLYTAMPPFAYFMMWVSFQRAEYRRTARQRTIAEMKALLGECIAAVHAGGTQ